MSHRFCTIQVLLQGVRDQTAVVRTRGQQVWDAVIVVIIVTLVSLPVLVGVQLGAVDDSRAVVPGVLVAVAVTGDDFIDFNSETLHVI